MIHLIHGIHPSQPGGTVAKLRPYLEARGYSVMVHEYGLALAATARFLNNRRAEKIGVWVKPHDIIIGHSNGCAIAHKIQQARKVQGLVLINAALDEDVTFDNTDWFHVYYNSGDGAVHWSKFLIAHSWGEMGRVGYTGTSTNGISFDCMNEPNMPKVDGHSEFFADQNIELWSTFMMDRIENAYTGRPSG